jgi:Tol biopolymer transport system component
MDSDGGNRRQLTTHTADDGFPAWSPDGRKIAFTSDRTGNFDIWVMDSDGGNQSQLTTHSADDGFPAWSPDGRKIAFESDRTGNFDICVLILE